MLIVYELGISSPSISVLDQQIRTVLENSPFQIELYREYLETTLFPDAKTQKEIRDGLTYRYQQRPLDVVLTIGVSPLQFLVESYKSSFKNVPVVFGGLSGVPIPDLPVDAQFTGVWDRIDPANTLDTALRLQPGITHVVVVGGQDAFDLELEKWFRDRLHSYESRLDFTYLTDLSMPQLLERLHSLPAHTIVLLTHIGLDAAGTRFIGASQADPMVVKASNMPVYGPSDVDLGHGEVGGYVDSFALQGKMLGEMVISILRGEKPRNIPIVRGANVYMFDWRALKRWGLDEKKVPAGSIVLNREPTVWEAYRWYIVGSVSLIAAETFLISALWWQRTKRRTAENELGIKYDQLRLAIEAGRFVGWNFDIRAGTNYWFGDLESIFGIRADHYVAPVGEFRRRVHPDDRDSVVSALGRAEQNKERYMAEFRVCRDDGVTRWVNARGQYYYGTDGSAERMLGLALDITERKLAEEALASVSRRLIQAQEQERTRIARELHDDVNQRLALFNVKLTNLAKQVQDPGAEVQGTIQELQLGISDLTNDIHEISHRLHSSKLEYLGLLPACRSFCREIAERHNVNVEFSADTLPAGISQEVSLTLFRILQEALQNGIKHGGARNFHVELHATASEIELTVNDNGKGFDLDAPLNGHGLGLISMRERANLVKGRIFVTSKPMAGTRVNVRVPINGASGASQKTIGAA